MILSKLRKDRGWSQEHLAKLSGLSVRTIQRIECGKKASLDSLMSLASVLEVDISTLKQEITVIDKTSEKWAKMPFHVKAAFIDSNIPVLGFRNRKGYLRVEIILALGGVLYLIAGNFILDLWEWGLTLLLCAYVVSLIRRLGDKYDVW